MLRIGAVTCNATRGRSEDVSSKLQVTLFSSFLGAASFLILAIFSASLKVAPWAAVAD